MNDTEKMRDILTQLNPNELSYYEWLRIGMACKSCGLDCEEWDAWSAKGAKYKKGECRTRWASFNDSVRIGTAVYVAQNHGFVVPREWKPSEVSAHVSAALCLGREEYAEKIRALSAALPPRCVYADTDNFSDLVNNGIYAGRENAAALENVDYINALFDDCDYIAYSHDIVNRVDQEDAETSYAYREVKIITAETAKRFAMQGHDDDPAATDDNGVDVFNNALYHRTMPQSILINPLKSKDASAGVKVENVARLRNVLVECDSLPLDEQYKILLATGAPISALVYSGNKSLHAIVRVDAETLEDYRKRFELLRDACAAYGMQIDTACSNANRWTRNAGAPRNGGGRVQHLIATHLGAENWEKWEKDINEAKFRAELAMLAGKFGVKAQDAKSIISDPPEAVPQIIEGALKAGCEGILIASSKAGKSWLMLELAAACADGGYWLGYKCKKSRVGVINMELGEDDIFERLSLISERVAQIQQLENIQFLNCRGVCSDLETLQALVETWANVYKLDIIIIDPIYSLMGGKDENSNGDVMLFLEVLSQIRRNTGAATFMTHHTSKGAQDGKKFIDMGSGAGAFARHPDMILTMQTATPENIKGVDAATIEATRANGGEYFVFNEVLRSFKSTRHGELWRADFPRYCRIGGGGYDAMGKAHKERAESAFDCWRAAAWKCKRDGIDLTSANVANAAGKSARAAQMWIKYLGGDWAAVLDDGE